MNKIKIRAWDIVTNTMHNSIEELCFENGILIEVIFKKSWDGFGSCTEEIVDWQNADQTVLMQFTGLKDKNGMEIYEGDILKTIGLYQEHFIVEYSDRSFELYDGKDGVVSDEHNIWDAYEIIGNIYENTKLL